MKVLAKWFRSDDETSVDTAAPASGAPGPALDYAEETRPDDYDEDTSFNWRALESSSSAIFDSPDTHRLRVLKSKPARPANDDNNPGYNPYDTGKFDTGENS